MSTKVVLFLSKVKGYSKNRLLLVRGPIYKTLLESGRVYTSAYCGFFQKYVTNLSQKEVS